MDPLGGVIHTYQGYDPVNFPPPTKTPPDVASRAFEHLLLYGNTRRLTPEDLANAIHLDPSQIKGLGPSLQALIEMLEERRRKILATYETSKARSRAHETFHAMAARMTPPKELEKQFRREVRAEQLRDLERLWYRADERSLFARELVQLVNRLGEKYQVEELASRYEFTGRTPMDVPRALEIKDELEKIDRLLAQLREAMKNARVALIDLDALREFADQTQISDLERLAAQVDEYLRQLAESQGLEMDRNGWKLSPKAMRIYQSKLLKEIFADLKAARSGRHEGVLSSDGAVELASTRPYEFGDSPANLDIVQSLINAMVREESESRTARAGNPAQPGPPATRHRVRLHSDDLVIHRTRRTPRCATAVILDMSGSMRYGGQYIACKRMALALDGLIRTEYPGDFLQCIEMYTLAKPRHISEVPGLLPKPISIHESSVRLRADLSDPELTELDLPLHFTNIQRSLQMARRFLGAQETPNRQILLITDGLPTAHCEGEQLYLLYPPDPRTERETMREALACQREGIVINIFLLPSWSQTQEDVGFAHRMAESTGGRVFFAGGKELDRFVVWDYVKRRRSIIG